jgi:hypothetical protein
MGPDFPEEAQRPPPRVLRRLGVVDFGPGVVEKRVLGVRIRMKLVSLAERRELLIEPGHDVRCDEPVLACPETQHRRPQGGEIRRDVGMAAIEHHARRDLGILRRGEQRVRSMSSAIISLPAWSGPVAFSP